MKNMIFGLVFILISNYSFAGNFEKIPTRRGRALVCDSGYILPEYLNVADFYSNAWGMPFDIFLTKNNTDFDLIDKKTNRPITGVGWDKDETKPARLYMFEVGSKIAKDGEELSKIFSDLLKKTEEEIKTNSFAYSTEFAAYFFHSNKDALQTRFDKTFLFGIDKPYVNSEGEKVILEIPRDSGISVSKFTLNSQEKKHTDIVYVEVNQGFFDLKDKDGKTLKQNKLGSFQRYFCSDFGFTIAQMGTTSLTSINKFGEPQERGYLFLTINEIPSLGK